MEKLKFPSLKSIERLVYEYHRLIILDPHPMLRLMELGLEKQVFDDEKALVFMKKTTTIYKNC